jgi:hypothetical protein
MALFKKGSGTNASPEDSYQARLSRFSGMPQSIDSDLARSMDHRRKFACSWNPANRPRKRTFAQKSTARPRYS